MPDDNDIEKKDTEHVGVGNKPEPIHEELKDLELDPDVKANYDKAFDYKKPFFKRAKHFITAESKAGRKAKVFKDFILTFVPYGRTISTTTEMATEILSDNQTTNDMNFTDKLKKVRNWISWNDKDGNFSPKELGLSVLKIVVSGGIVYGAIELGIWDGLVKIMGG